MLKQMDTQNFRTALRYRLHDNVKGMLTFYAILLLIGIVILTAIFWTTRAGNQVTGTFSYTEISSVIFMFVMGLVVIRSDFPFFVQNGLNRASIFSIQQITIILFALLFGVASEILNYGLALGMPLTGGSHAVTAGSLYQSIYNISGVTFLIHLKSVFFTAALCFFANELGLFISLFYYRAKRSLKIIVSIAVPAFFFIVLPNLAVLPSSRGIVEQIFRTLYACVSTIGGLCLFTLLCSIVLGFFSWLFLRRAALR